ncbi:MAG: carboxypeptidase M32 [Rhodospirillaceae bacterium]
MAREPYLALKKSFKRIGALREAQAILHWDMAVMMPSGSAGGRTEQISELNLVVHEILNSSEFEDLLIASESDPPEAPWDRANLAEMRRLQVRATALTSDLVSTLTRSAAECEMSWREARPASDFSMVASKLDLLLSLIREKASALGSVLDCTPYEALMDEFEPSSKVEVFDRLFDQLLTFLPALLDKALSQQEKRGRLTEPEGPFPIEAQKILAEKLMRSLGFDFSRGRLDVSLHPFCGGVPDDIRITTRYSENNFFESLMGVLHETGHALYESHLPTEWRSQPVGQARGMALHESQSLLVEMQLCRSEQFLNFLVPLIRESFPEMGYRFDGKTLKALYHKVRPDFIRVDADEITYPFHVILRYRLEKSLLSGDLSISDLPNAWNEGMEELLGITPSNDRLGCLQDIHWFSGSFGYFPTYTLGALAAAQIFQAINKAIPDLGSKIASGNFTEITKWCAKNIHGRASSSTTEKILQDATGQGLGTEAFRLHLESRYLA